MKGKICLAGKSDALVKALQHAISQYPREMICALPSRSDHPEHTWQYSVSRFCRDNNIETITLEQAYSMEDLLLISIQYDLILRPERFRSVRLYNIHFSLLPAYKGVYPAIWPILNGEVQSGVTLHVIDSGIDTGDVIDQLAVPILLNDTARDLYLKCQEAAVIVFKKNLEDLLNKEYVSNPQPSVGSFYYSKNSIDFSNNKIDLNRTAYQIHNQVRAFNFREYQMPTLFERKMFKSEITSVKSKAKAGTVLHETEKYITVATIDYDLNIYFDYYDIFFEACATGNLHDLEAVLHKIPDLSVTTKEGWTGLIIASHHEHLPVVKKLVENGADVNSTNYRGTSVLMYAKSSAARSGRTDVMEYLISKGAKLNWSDHKGRSLLEYAREENNAGVIDFLLKKGAK